MSVDRYRPALHQLTKNMFSKVCDTCFYLGDKPKYMCEDCLYNEKIVKDV